MLYAFCMLFLNRITNFYTSMGGTTVLLRGLDCDTILKKASSQVSSIFGEEKKVTALLAQDRGGRKREGKPMYKNQAPGRRGNLSIYL